MRRREAFNRLGRPLFAASIGGLLLDRFAPGRAVMLVAYLGGKGCCAIALVVDVNVLAVSAVKYLCIVESRLRRLVDVGKHRSGCVRA